MYSKFTNFVFPFNTRFSATVLILIFCSPIILGQLFYESSYDVNNRVLVDDRTPPKKEKKLSAEERGHLIGAVIILSIFALIILFILTMTEGIKIDLAKKRYKHYLQIFGLKFRKWMPLKEPLRLILVINKEKHRASAGYTPSINLPTVYFYALKLVVGKRPDKYVIAKGRNKAKVRKRGIDLSKYLSIPIEDITREK